MSFYGVNSVTNVRINSIEIGFSEEFYKEEKWYADPNDIEICPKGLDINKIETHYRKISKEIISKSGIVYYKKPHFFIPNAEKLGLKVRLNQKGHTQAVNFIYNLLKSAFPLVISKVDRPVKYEIEEKLDYNLFDLSKLSVEVSIKNKNIRRVDILMPLKKYQENLGHGIAFEVQLSKQSDGEELDRSYDIACKGFSVVWLKPEDFVDIKKEILELCTNKLKIESIGSILNKGQKKMVKELKELTINYTKMINEHELLLNEKLNKFLRPDLEKCPKCEKGLLVLNEGITKKGINVGKPYIMYKCTNCEEMIWINRKI